MSIEWQYEPHQLEDGNRYWFKAKFNLEDPLIVPTILEVTQWVLQRCYVVVPCAIQDDSEYMRFIFSKGSMGGTIMCEWPSDLMPTVNVIIDYDAQLAAEFRLAF